MTNLLVVDDDQNKNEDNEDNEADTDEDATSAIEEDSEQNIEDILHGTRNIRLERLHHGNITSSNPLSMADNDGDLFDEADEVEPMITDDQQQTN